MKIPRGIIIGLILLSLSYMFAACNMSGKGSSGGVIPAATMDEEENEWLGKERPTPTSQTGKVGSGKMHIDGNVVGLGAELESSVVVPFTIYRTGEGKYQILGSSDQGIMKVNLVGTGCTCKGNYQMTSEINGTITGTDTGGCKILFSETRIFGTGDCVCDCPDQTVSCEDAIADIEDLGPFEIDFHNDAQHSETGENNGVTFDESWVIKDLAYDSEDCFSPDVIEHSP